MKKYFLTGLVILLPLALTVAVLMFVINLLTAPFIGGVHGFLEHFDFLENGFLFLSRDHIITFISQFLILSVLFLLTTFLGLLAKWFLIHYLLQLGDYFLHRIPLFNKIYMTSQEIIKTVLTSKKRSFKQVVIVSYPNKDIYSIGFITNDAPSVCSKEAGDELVSVFMPTTPNPTSGYLVMFKRKDVVLLDMSVEDAVKFIISCGVIYPHKVEKK